MDHQKHDRLRRLFDEASDLPKQEQEAFLKEAAGDDADLLKSLRKLLSLDSEHELAIDLPVVNELGIKLAEELDGAIEAAETEERLPHPDMIGPYRILRVLGRGGMGIVYEAEQTTPTRRVALKVLRADVATPGMLRRFEHETLVLGRLNHPGIAQIYDAGIAETDGGQQPYLAMELVRGKTLTEHADTLELDKEGRLELLAAVADAVQHAHEQGVIHRDLKPANVLVDESGQVKVLDFGVATTLDVDQHLSTMHTGIGEVVGTLSYMSPEQVTGRSSEVDARSDVYALGVLAHELLTGRPPFDLKGKLIHEAARIVAEVEPSTLSAHDESLRGDVEWIVGKALEKEAARRYSSAAALASDLRRHLANEPISAGAPSAWYKAMKFSRRHRAWVGGISATLLALVAGLVTSTVLYTRARDRGIELAQALEESEAATALARDRGIELAQALEESEAATALARDRGIELAQALEESEAVSAFIEGIFGGALPWEPGKELTVRTMLERSRDSLDEDHQDSPRTSSRLHHTVAKISFAIGALELALFHAERAYDLRASDPTVDLTLRSESEIYYGEILIAVGQPDEAHLVLAAGLERQTDVPLRARYLLQLASIEKYWGDLLAAHALLDELSKIENHLGVPEETRLGAVNLRAILHARVGNIEEAMSGFERVLAWRLSELGEDAVLTLDARSNLATALSMQGKHAEVLELDLAMLETRKRMFGKDHPSTLHTMFGIGAGLSMLGRNDEAVVYMREAVEGNLRVLGGGHVDTLSSRQGLAVCLEAQGKHEEAQGIFLDATEEAMESLGETHWVTLLLMDNHGITLRSLGRFDEAIRLHRDAVELSKEGLGPINSMAINALTHLALTLDAAGRHGEAIEAAERAVTMQASPEIGTPSTGMGAWLVDLYLRAEPAELQDPERALQLALALPPETAGTVEACIARARAFDRLTRWEEAAQALDEAIAGLPALDPQIAKLVGERDSLRARSLAARDED